MALVLVVDDDLSIREMLRTHIMLAGHVCLLAEDGQKARNLLDENQIDIVLLDIMMPGEDGFSLAHAFFERNIPVLFLTAKTAVNDRVKGLQSGAEDYILKPFEPAELMARIEVVLRRNDANPKLYQDELLRIDFDARTVECGGVVVPLTILEFDLLALLVEKAGCALRREVLLAQVWGYGFTGETRTVDVHVQRLRRKLGGSIIETVYKYGYRYNRKEPI